MGTSKTELSSWFDDGVKQGATHMIVACDTFDWEDYPAYVTPEQNVIEVLHKEYNFTAEQGQGELKNMQKVMEVYDLRMDKQAQLNERRAFHF